MALRDDQHVIPECVTGMIVPFPTHCPILQTRFDVGYASPQERMEMEKE
jgi:hypothetical protein